MPLCPFPHPGTFSIFVCLSVCLYFINYNQAMIKLTQTSTFRKWEEKLKDQRAKAAIAARIFRLSQGLPGDVQPVGQGVSEFVSIMALDTGFTSDSVERKSSSCFAVEIKNSQARDIEMARKLAAELAQDKGE